MELKYKNKREQINVQAPEFTIKNYHTRAQLNKTLEPELNIYAN